MNNNIFSIALLGARTIIVRTPDAGSALHHTITQDYSLTLTSHLTKTQAHLGKRGQIVSHTPHLFRFFVNSHVFFFESFPWLTTK